MAEWLVEAGIGEDRAILVAEGKIIAARVHIHGGPAIGAVLPGRLVRKLHGARGIARLDNGFDVIVVSLPASLCEGEKLMLRITREAMAEAGRFKLALARPANGETPCPSPTLAELLGKQGVPVRQLVLNDPADAFGAHGWDELTGDALAGHMPFAGGSLLLSPTPAMTVIDIDGELPPRELALAAAPAVAAALEQFDIGGSVAIDFPTLAAKADRQALDNALASALTANAERTAMNGFGLVQIVRRLERRSLLHAYRAGDAGTGARMLMRKAERTRGTGPLLLSAPSAVRSAVSERWIGLLLRRTGASGIEWRIDETLAPEAAFAHRLAG